MAIWLPRAVTTNAAPRPNVGAAIFGPSAANDNNDSSSDNGNDNFTADNGNDNSSASDNGNDNTSGNKNSNDNTSGNNNTNDNSSNATGGGNNPSNPSNPTAPTGNTGDPSKAGAQVKNGSLTVDLARTADHPVVNQQFQITVRGSGAPIESLSWWAEGGNSAGPNNDDLAHIGTQTFACNGAQDCSQSWNIVPRNVGYYTLHAKVRDTSGTEVQTDWQFLASENAR